MSATDTDEVAIELADGTRLSGWTTQTHNEVFGRACNDFSFALGGKETAQRAFSLLKPGTKLGFLVNGVTVASGYSQKRNLKPARPGGWMLTVTGRDASSVLCDSSVDPLQKFSAKTTLNDLFTKVVKPFGVFPVISTNDLANRSVITGNDPRTSKRLYSPSTIAEKQLDANAKNSTVSKQITVVPGLISEYDPTKPKQLKDYTLDQLKPNQNGEGCYEFLARQSKRFRLGLWSDAYGTTLIVDAPEFDRPAYYSLRRTATTNDVLEGECDDDISEMPTLIIATGIFGGGNFKAAKIKVAVVNELTGYTSLRTIRPEVKAILDAHKIKKVVAPRKELFAYASRFAESPVRAAQMHDEESRTHGQLEGYVRYEMSSRQAKCLQAKQKVRGHTSASGLAWTVNTIVDLEDEALDLHGRWWIKERSFTKSRSGTFTDLTLIPTHMFQF